MGELTRITGAGAESATADQTFGYDLAGRLTTASGAAGTNTISLRRPRPAAVHHRPVGRRHLHLQRPTDARESTPPAPPPTATTPPAGCSPPNTTTGVQLGYGYNISANPQITYGDHRQPPHARLRHAAPADHDELKTPAGATIAKITYG